MADAENNNPSTPFDQGFLARDVWLLRLRALMAATRGHDELYFDVKHRYGAMATSLGYEGHMKWAEAMP